MSFLSFRLNDAFVEKYSKRDPNWGMDIGGGNKLSELIFVSKYSRLKDNGTKEEWYEVCRRCIEGYFSILKDHCKKNLTPWNDLKAQKSAQDAYDRMFQFKWTPPGRGLQFMGTDAVHGEQLSSALQNCSYLSTGKISTHSRKEAVYPFVTLFEQCMTGVGVGFDVKGAGRLEINEPTSDTETFVVPDNREGWSDALGELLVSFFFKNKPTIEFDYSEIRPLGAPLKRFGGTASGPEPLERCLESIRSQFSNRSGESITSRDIVDIMNKVAKATVAGGARRSALISLGPIDDEDFVNLKNWNLPENSERTGEDGWAWSSNNSVVIDSDEDLDRILDKIQVNGEPGVLFIDVARKFSRLCDPVDNKDWRIEGINPCFSGDTMLLTNEGWVSFEENSLKSVDGETQSIVVDGRVSYDPSDDSLEHPENWKVDLSGYHPTVSEASYVFKTKENAEVYEVVASNGLSFKATPDHLMATKRGMVAVEDLIEGKDKILVTKGFLPERELGDPETQEEIDAILMGLIAGDGCFKKGVITDKAVINLWGKDKSLLGKIKEWIQSTFDSFGSFYESGSNRPFTAFNTFAIEERDEARVSSSFLGVYLKDKYGFCAETKGVMPESIMANACSRASRFYVAALAFCDGTVGIHSKGKSSNSIRINQSNKQLLDDVLLVCLANGISGSVYSRREAQTRMMPNGKGGSSAYETKENFEVIFSSNAFEFAKFIGALGEAKHEEMLRENPFTSRKQNTYAKVESVSYAGKEDVYCLREDERRILCANGFTARRCGEQPLEDGEACTLVETFPSNHEDFDDYKETLKHAYLYGKAVTLLPTAWPETNEVMTRNRRIGLSMTGISQFVDTRGWTDLKHWSNNGYEFIQHRDKKYSEWLGVRESIKTTTVKPSGTVSLLASVTAGVHWPVASGQFVRTVRYSKGDPLVALLEEAGYKTEKSFDDPSSTVVVYLPVETEECRSEREVSIWEKAELAAFMQRWWSDNSVSCTVTFQPHEVDQIGPLLKAKAGQMKSISFLPLSEGEVYRQAPYMTVSDDEFAFRRKNLNKIPKKNLYSVEKEFEADKFCTGDQCEISF